MRAERTNPKPLIKELVFFLSGDGIAEFWIGIISDDIVTMTDLELFRLENLNPLRHIIILNSIGLVKSDISIQRAEEFRQLLYLCKNADSPVVSIGLLHQF